MKRFALVMFFGVFIFSGCASPKEVWRGFAGTSTKVLEEGRPKAVAKEFAYDHPVCYKKVMSILEDMKAYVYAKDKNRSFIAVYVTSTDTTPVGLFLTSASSGRTKIEVSSPSTFARESFSAKLFGALDKSLKAKKVDVELKRVEEGSADTLKK
ncbi:MAG: hypothetical protein PHH68_03515 [Candidatus Omnitrophica bacterium]|jgi:hypothetical protein|nr:hypothetical protein [Candidatus Omnitrophota bacterium]MDD5079376.1 hypothetical protein [Candidatus Omnitrophota bacterium]